MNIFFRISLRGISIVITLCYQARLHHKLEQLFEAETLYDKLINSDISDPIIFIEAGKLADEMGENQRAVSRLQKVTTCNEKIAFEAYCELAIVHMHGGRFEQAGVSWWKASRLNRTQSRPWAGVLVCALASNKATLVARASEMLDQRCNPITRRELVAGLWTHAACGKTINEQTRKKELEVQIASPLESMLSYASTILAEHADRFPSRADTWYHLANCQRANDQMEDALNSVKEAIQINPKYTSAIKLNDALKAA